jgi:hypothetical protein
MPNFVDILNRQFSTILAASPDYKDKVEFTRDETYKEIINTICNYYNLSFTEDFANISSTELYGIAHIIYDIFVSRFTDYMINFYISFIINNIDNIYANLINDDTVKKIRDKDLPVKSYINPKLHLIHANLNKVILDMETLDIPLELLLQLFTDNSTASRLSQLLEDRGDIYKNYYTIYLKDQRYMAEMLTCIKLRLQAATQQAYDISANIKK